MKGVTRMIAAIGSGVFMFIVFLMVTLFFCNNIVEGMPTWYQIVGYGTCLVVALLAGVGSYRQARKM